MHEMRCPWCRAAADLGSGSGVPASGGKVDKAVLADLAAASRILADQGVVDAFGHVSLRHPSAPDRFFISRSMAPALVQPDDLMEFSLDGTACGGAGMPCAYAGCPDSGRRDVDVLFASTSEA